MQKKRLISLIALLAALTAAIVIIIDFDSEARPLAEGDQLPNLEMELYGEGEQELYSYFGNIIVLNVWASWCEPCIREMPELMDFASASSDEIDVITVNMQTREYRQTDATDFIDEHGLTLPVFLDREGTFLAEVEPSRLPMTYILDREFQIKEILIGEVTEEMLHEKINELFS